MPAHRRAARAYRGGKRHTSIPVTVDLANNPSLGRARLAADQLGQGHDVSAMLKRRNISDEVATAIEKIVGKGTVTRPNARRQGHPLTLPIRLERDREALYRGAYVLKAAERVQEAVNSGKTLDEALTAERRYFAQHETARAGRLQAVTNAARIGAWYGEPTHDKDGNYRTLVGWYLNPLIANDPECVLANGHNFYAEEGTTIGYPGGVHPNCGCYAGTPIAGAGMVNDAIRANVSTLSIKPMLKPKQLKRRTVA